MKIAIRGGHSLDVRGASGVVDEVTEDRKIYAKVRDYLKQLGHDVLDVTPGNSGTSSIDLSVAVNKANAWGSDYFVSIHLNATPGGYGTEVLYKSDKGRQYAERIVNEIAALGFRNRGAKADTRSLYEFNHVVAPNNIVECFFCDSQSDVDLYNKVGIDALAKAIAKGITGQEVIEVQPAPAISYDFDKAWKIRGIQALCNTLGVKDKNGNALAEDGKPGPLTQSAVAKLPVLKQGSSNITAIKVMQEIVGTVVDGSFGPSTLAAVKRWQAAHGLAVDGSVGPKTWTSLLLD